MAFNVRHPIYLSATPKRAAWAFALLFLIESVARSCVSTVLPLHAYDLLKSKETVSWLYTLVSLAALGLSFFIPMLIRTFSRRWTYTFGILALILSGAGIALDSIAGQVVGMLFRTFGAAMLNITLNLYIMDYIRKTDLVKSEPLRYTISTFAWSIGPLAGVWLYKEYGSWAPGLLMIVASICLGILFWYYRLSEKGPIRPGKIRPPSPFASIGRFWRQPRLRLAWLIAFGRSIFWVTFFIYVPILMVEGTGTEIAAGVIIGLGNLTLFSNALIGRLSVWYSVRQIITVAFMAGAALVFVSGFAGTAHPYVAGALLVGASFFVSFLDGVGPIPFLRAVHSHERPQMTTVYRTYLDASELLPPFIYIFAFMLFGFSGAFWTLAIAMAGIGLVAWTYLPRGL